MAGVKGMRIDRKKDKPWAEALALALNRPDKEQPSVRRLELVANAVIRAAIAGDMTAAKEIGDRLDGKATQPLAGDADSAPLKLLVEWARGETPKE